MRVHCLVFQNFGMSDRANPDEVFLLMVVFLKTMIQFVKLFIYKTFYL